MKKNCAHDNEKKNCVRMAKKSKKKKNTVLPFSRTRFWREKKFSLFIFIFFLKIILGNNKFQDNHKFFVSKTRFLNKTKKNFIFF